MKATLKHIEKLTDDICMFWFEPETAFDYIAGQFVQLHLEHVQQDERGSRRWFTLSSSPSEEMLAITVKIQGTQLSSFKQALRNMTPGDMLDVSDPMGDFVLPKDAGIPLTFIAAGIGITPFRSMVTFLRDTKEQRDITMHYIVPSTEHAVFHEIFEAYGVQLQIIPTSIKESRFHISQIVNEPATLQGRLFYVSGPELMVEDIAAQLTDAGAAPHQIVTDYFHGYTAV